MSRNSSLTGRTQCRSAGDTRGDVLERQGHRPEIWCRIPFVCVTHGLCAVGDDNFGYRTAPQNHLGKTLRPRYAHWNKIGPYLDAWTSRDAVIHAELNRTCTLYYTPYSGTTPRRIRDDIHKSSRRVDACIDEHLTPATTTTIHTSGQDYTELLIIDEAERLTASSLEMLRDEYDRATHGPDLHRLPGIENASPATPQLYSRAGDAAESLLAAALGTLSPTSRRRA